MTNDKMIEFERCVWDRGRNSHSDINVAKADGISTTIASGQNQMAFLHEMMENNFGDAWVYGGKISVRYIHPVYPGDLLPGIALRDAALRVHGYRRPGDLTGALKLDSALRSGHGDYRPDWPFVHAPVHAPSRESSSPWAWPSM